MRRALRARHTLLVEVKLRDAPEGACNIDRFVRNQSRQTMLKLHSPGRGGFTCKQKVCA